VQDGPDHVFNKVILLEFCIQGNWNKDKSFRTLEYIQNNFVHADYLTDYLYKSNVQGDNRTWGLWPTRAGLDFPPLQIGINIPEHIFSTYLRLRCLLNWAPC
jgi:hypothetical protein